MVFKVMDQRFRLKKIIIKKNPLLADYNKYTMQTKREDENNIPNE
jgi:hypothetical protein